MRKVCLLVICLVACGGSALATSYQYTYFAKNHAYRSYAADINDDGLVVGWIWKSGTYAPGFLWSRTNGLIEYPGMPIANRTRINNCGQIVCNNDATTNTAYLWDSQNGKTNLNNIWGGESSAEGINDDGVIVGGMRAPGSNYSSYAVIWDSTNGLRQIPVGGYRSGAIDINNVGQVAGYMQVTKNTLNRRPFIWDEINSVTYLDMPDGYNAGQAYYINNNGQVLGACWNLETGEGQSLVWDKVNGPKIIEPASGYFGVQIFDINDNGQVVGCVSANDTKYSMPYVWDSINGMKILPGVNWGIATGINNKGEIVGASGIQSPYYEAVLWTPVPEPSSIAALLLGLGSVGVFIKRRR